MKLTAPLHILKRKAKDLKRSQSLTMTEALNIVARTEGFQSWSHLHAGAKSLIPDRKEDVLDYLNPGDLVLIGARPGLGKTTFALELLLQAAKDGRRGFFFSFEYNEVDIPPMLAKIDPAYGHYAARIKFDFSDEISARYVIAQTADLAVEGSVIVVDYLQLLDQQRNKPPLQSQIEELKVYARAQKSILIFISQIDRTFLQKKHDHPTRDDIRLPNPLDVKLFNKVVFVQNDRIYFDA